MHGLPYVSCSVWADDLEEFRFFLQNGAIVTGFRLLFLFSLFCFGTFTFHLFSTTCYGFCMFILGIYDRLSYPVVLQLWGGVVSLFFPFFMLYTASRSTR